MATPDADAVNGDEFVADEPDQTGCGDPADMLYRDWVDQTPDRFDPGDDGRQGDHRDHEQSRDVFGATVTVGVAPGGGLGAECERDPQRNRGQRVREVVDGVGQ